MIHFLLYAFLSVMLLLGLYVVLAAVVVSGIRAFWTLAAKACADE